MPLATAMEPEPEPELELEPAPNLEPEPEPEALSEGVPELQTPTIGSLPDSTLRHVLLTASCHEDIFAHLAACALVCREWWRHVRGSAAYAPAGDERRARLLRRIYRSLRGRWGAEGNGGSVDCRPDPTDRLRIGDDGARALGTVLLSMPPPLALTKLILSKCELTAAGVGLVARSLRKSFAAGGLWALNVSDNPGLGDDGVSLLAEALPPTLETINFANTGCGDSGMSALSAALTRLTVDTNQHSIGTWGMPAGGVPRKRQLSVGQNPAVTEAGWAALGAAIPRIPGLRSLNAQQCDGMGDGGVAALVAGLPEATELSSLNLRGTALGDAGVRALATAMYGCRDAQGELWAMQLTLSAQARAGSAAGSDGMLARLLAGSAISDEAKELLHDAICSDGAPEPRGREPSPWGSGRILWT